MRDESETLALILANGLDPDALETNRSSLLTSQQTKELQSRRLGMRVILLVIAVICISLGAFGLAVDDPESGGVGAFVVLMIGLVVLVVRFSHVGRSYAIKIAAGRVASLEGFVGVRRSSSRGDSGSSDWYFYKIAGNEFQPTEEDAKLIPESRYRIYYLPDTDNMLNIEPIGQAVAAELSAEDVSAIVGEPMRVESETVARGAAWPRMVTRAFGSATSRLHVVVGFLLGAQDSSILNFYRRILTSRPDYRTVTGLGDAATFARGQLLVRRGDVFILVIVVSLDRPRDSEHLLDIEHRLAALALRSL